MRTIEPAEQQMSFVEYTSYWSCDPGQPHRGRWMSAKGNFWDTPLQAARMAMRWGESDIFWQQKREGLEPNAEVVTYKVTFTEVSRVPLTKALEG